MSNNQYNAIRLPSKEYSYEMNGKQKQQQNQQQNQRRKQRNICLRTLRVTHTDRPLCVLSWNLIVWNMKSNDTIETNAK